MAFKRSFVTFAIGLSLLTSEKVDGFFGFGDCFDNTDGLWDSIRCKGWETTIDATGGYRHDKLTCLINAFDPPGTFISSDNLQAKNLSVWEWGLKARLRLGNAYAKAWGTFGFITDGKYTETGIGATGATSISRAKIKTGKVEDASFGGGYLFEISDCFALAPTAGWAYNYQKVKLKHSTTDGVADTVLDGVSYKNRWQGPWLGFDTVASISCLAINLGYEYHWAHWHAAWELKGADVTGGAFSDRRKSKHASGNVVYLNTYWNAFDCLDAGILLKYQYWRAKKGTETPLAGSFTAVGLGATEVDKVQSARWESYEIQFSLGYTF